MKVQTDNLPETRDIFGALILAVVVTAVLTGYITGMEKEESSQDEMKVAVVVLDGADWKPVNQLREEDRVPNIENFIEEGVHGSLSSPYSFSPVSWTIAATGRAGPSLSIEDWNTQTEDGGQRMVRQEDVEHRRTWEYLNDADITTGVSSWLLTWPVEEVEGFMISGPMRTSDSQIYYPEDEFTETEEEIIRGGSEWKEAEMSMERRDKVDFLALGMKNLDVIQHHLWKFVDPEPFGMERKEEHKEYREVVYTEYEKLDGVLGGFDEDWNVLVFGTSGFEPENNRRFPSPSTSYALSVNPVIEALGYSEFREETVRGTAVKEPEQGSQLKRCPLEYPRNDVINSTTIQFRMCILDKGLDVERVIEDFGSIEYQDGRNVFTDIDYREDEDDILIKQRIYRDVFSEQEFKETPTNQPLADGPMPYIDPMVEVVLPDGEILELWIGPEKSGDHPPGTDSIFMAKGPALQEGKELSRGSISTRDITPTVLYMYGLPIPEQMEGRPVLELFNEDFRRSRSVRTEDISTNKSSVYLEEIDEKRDTILSKRLRDVGYMVRER